MQPKHRQQTFCWIRNENSQKYAVVLISDSAFLKNQNVSEVPNPPIMVIIPLLAIEFKAIPNRNTTNHFYWKQKSNLMLCNETPAVGLLIFTI